MGLNQNVLMSGADYFSVADAINPYMHPVNGVDKEAVKTEHTAIKQALLSAGVKVEQVPPPKNCQDGVYTANWALVKDKTAVLASLPNARKAEEAYAKSVLEKLGLKTIAPPYRFSGQGDALPCGNYLFCGSNYRTDPKMHEFLAEALGYEVVGLQTIPLLDSAGKPIINKVSGWPDSFFYDIDLAISILRNDLIAWCPNAFTPKSQDKITALPLDKIEVSLDEAKNGLACNLVSTGETVVMSANASELKKDIESHGLKVVTVNARQLAKGGGYIRCTSLTLD